jgi:DNA modification methylase
MELPSISTPDMPTLNWLTKKAPDIFPTDMILDSVFYPRSIGYPDAAPENHLFLGDNLRIISSLLPEYENRLDLIYADPPFFSNKGYPARIGRGEDSRHPKEWQMVEGYTDHWDNLDAYLDFLYPRLVLMYRLLAPHGTLYLHLDWHADAYARLLLDEIFGRERFLNEIIWTYHGPSPIRRAFNRKHDVILVFTKSDDYIFNTDAVREPYHPNTIKTFGSSSKAGFGKIPDLERGKVPEDWWYFPVVARMHNERTGYPTQKPEALMERILLASSNPGGLVADFFCGSGTFPVVAARHDRRFLASDIAWRAVHTTRERLMDRPQTPISFSRESTIKIPSSHEKLLFAMTDQSITLKDPPALDYWEVDPGWDGRIFHSAIQARRPNRSSEIPLELKMPVAPTNVCVRAVTVGGMIIQSNI